MAKKIRDSKELAAQRVLKAEEIVYQAVEDLARAQAEISVVGTGLNQQWAKIDELRGKLKTIMYDLRRCRESGFCDLDEAVAKRLILGPAIGGSLKRRVAAGGAP